MAHYISEWRRYRGLTLEQTIRAMPTDPKTGEPPMSFMNLNRIERHVQPYNERTLELIGLALDVRPAALILVDPFDDIDLAVMIDRLVDAAPEARRRALLAIRIALESDDI